jgi:hypothetical protein
MIVVAAISAVVIFLGGNLVFPPMEMPPMSLLPAFLFLKFWDALAFGVGIALLIYLALNYSKWPKKIRGSLLVLFFIALWFSVLTWVHDGAHGSGAAPPNFAYLALVEFMFHFPWLIFALALAMVTMRLARVYTKHQVR